jgi:hypothetical protein
MLLNKVMISEQMHHLVSQLANLGATIILLSVDNKLEMLMRIDSKSNLRPEGFSIYLIIISRKCHFIFRNQFEEEDLFIVRRC